MKKNKISKLDSYSVTVVKRIENLYAKVIDKNCSNKKLGEFDDFITELYDVMEERLGDIENILDQEIRNNKIKE